MTEDFDSNREALRGATWGYGPFDAEAAKAAVSQKVGDPLEGDDVGTLLDELTQLGYLRRLPADAGPQRYEWIDEEESPPPA
jgi:hypothetical protein